ncbi:MAG: thioredoxin domain-containing protein [Candidatus Melainabacteria bacterium]
MFRRCFQLVLTVLSIVFITSFVSQMIVTAHLPSAYDPGVSIQTAFKTSKKPLLIEFYSDTCTTCRRMAPLIHDLYNDHYQQDLTLVMLDVNNPANYEVSQLFGLKELPGIYVFDFKHMKKHMVASEHFRSKESVRAELDRILKQRVASHPNQTTAAES